jgi:hypothetical protein
VGSGGAASTGGTVATAGAGSSLFFDDFESGASKWAQSPAGTDWAIASDGSSVFKESTLTGKELMAAASAGPFSDMVVEARVKVLQFSGQSTGYYAAICARFKDADNFFYLALSSDGKLSIRQKFAASNTRLSTPVDSGIVVNTWYTLRLSAIGNVLTAFVNDTQKATFTVSSNPIASGGVGLATYNAVVEYDDVRVSAP